MGKFSNLNLQTSDDARKIAKKRLPKMAFDYFDGAALTEYGEFLGRQAIKEIRLAPKVLGVGSNREINHKILGRKTDLPFGIAPMGMCNLSHPRADKIIAKAGATFNTPVCFSTMASTSMEETIGLTNGNGWFQLYVYDDPQAGLDMAKRAQKAGYKTLILTVDVPDLGRRPRELRQNFKVPWWPTISQFIDCAIHPSWSISMLLAGGSPSPANFKDLPPFRRDRPRAGAAVVVLSVHRVWATLNTRASSRCLVTLGVSREMRYKWWHCLQLMRTWTAQTRCVVETVVETVVMVTLPRLRSCSSAVAFPRRVWVVRTMSSCEPLLVPRTTQRSDAGVRT